MSIIRYVRARPTPFLGGAALIVLLAAGLLFVIDEQCDRWSRPVPAHTAAATELPTADEAFGSGPPQLRKRLPTFDELVASTTDESNGPSTRRGLETAEEFLGPRPDTPRGSRTRRGLETAEEFLGPPPRLTWQGRYLCDGREPSGAVIWLWIGSLALLGIVALTVASTIVKFIDRVLFALFAIQPFRAMVRRWRSYPKDSR